MYAHAFDGEGIIRKIGEADAPVGDRRLATFAVVDADRREVARLQTSPFGRGAIPFMSPHTHITTPPSAFVSRADAERLEDGMHVRLKVGGRFLPGRRDRNVIADIPGRLDDHIIVSAHYDSVWHGPGAIDNASGVEGVRRLGELVVGRELERGVRLVGFGAEEIKLTGSRLYVDEAKLRGGLKEIAAVVNLDCIARGDNLNVLASPAAMLDRAVESARAVGALDRYELVKGPATGGVDSHWFAQEGIPAVTLAHFPYEEYHLPDDSAGLADEQLVADTVELARNLVESLLEHPVAR
jgi:Iap family predicted aminopeptidase